MKSTAFSGVRAVSISLLLWCVACAATAVAALPAAKARVFDVRAFGATGNGKTLDTDAISGVVCAVAPACE